MRPARIAAAAVFAAAPALAQAPAQLEQQYADLFAARRTLMTEADAAIAAENWSVVCAKGKEVVAQTNRMAALLEQLRDALDEDIWLEDAEYESMSFGVLQLLTEAGQLDQLTQDGCTRASQP